MIITVKIQYSSVLQESIKWFEIKLILKSESLDVIENTAVSASCRVYKGLEFQTVGLETEKKLKEKVRWGTTYIRQN